MKPDFQRVDVLRSRLKQAEKRKALHAETLERLRKEQDKAQTEYEAAEEQVRQLQAEIGIWPPGKDRRLWPRPPHRRHR